MGYEAMGAVHAWLARAWARGRERGSAGRGRSSTSA